MNLCLKRYDELNSWSKKEIIVAKTLVRKEWMSKSQEEMTDNGKLKLREYKIKE